MSLGRRLAILAVVGVAIAAATTAVVVRSDAGVEPGSFADKKPASAGKAIGTPSRWTGPQGDTGQFVVHCTYTHSATNDPIVYPGQKGYSHRHDFYGPPKVDQNSTPDSLVASSSTSCDKPGDKAAYWHPTLYDHGQIVEPLDLSAYYRAAPGVDPKQVVPFPFGLAMLAGDQHATTPQPGEATGWSCGVRTTLSDDPPTCPSTARLHLVLTFPDCWDGTYADSEDHVSHVAYSDHGTCPKGFPKHIPQLVLSIRFPIDGDGHDLTLASGNIYSAHGDFLDGWEPDALSREIDACIHRGAVCDLASNRQDDPLFAYNH